MGKLDGATCYLSGAMEMVADHGIGWRRKFIKLCEESDLKIDFLDPTNKPGSDESQKLGEDKNYQTQLKTECRWNELQEYVQGYRRLDLRFVDLSDFLITSITPTVPQWGTANELYFAEMQHKPIFFICEGGLNTLPNWLFDVIDLPNPEKKKRCNVFTSVEEVVAELIGFDQGFHHMNNKWVLVRKKVELSRSYRFQA
jgi:hypothetical protein